MDKKVQTFSIFDNTMPGFNEIIAAAKMRSFRTRNYNGYAIMKKNWGERLSLAIRESGITKVKRAFFEIDWLEKNKKRDPDNIAAFVKFIFDGLQKEGIIENDGWKQIAGWVNSFHVTGQRGVIVNIYEEEYRKNRIFQQELWKKHKNT
jgi:Holliday junction resolvase RusA-like endonuclease